MGRIAAALRRLAATALLGGVLAATLVRFAPGFGSDEEQLDVRRGASYQEKQLAGRRAEADIPAYYARYLKGLLRGDFGHSRLLERPVAELLKDRAKPTLKALACGLAVGWAGGLAVALLWLRGRRAAWGTLVALPGVGLQCLPAAVVALLLFGLGARGPLAAGLAIGCVLVPRIAEYAGNILSEVAGSGFVLAARARGLSGPAVLWNHILRGAAAQLAALAGVSISMGLSAAIPMETVLDVPGLGQLAWQAALGRDLNLLVSLTLLMSLLVTAANQLGDLPGEASTAQPARLEAAQ